MQGASKQGKVSAEEIVLKADTTIDQDAKNWNAVLFCSFTSNTFTTYDLFGFVVGAFLVRIIYDIAKKTNELIGNVNECRQSPFSCLFVVLLGSSLSTLWDTVKGNAESGRGVLQLLVVRASPPDDLCLNVLVASDWLKFVGF